MKYIPLTQGKFALVDDADFAWLSQWKWYWHNCGYAARKPWQVGKGNLPVILMHRLIMGAPKGMDVDHINGDRLDNRRSVNLRLATRRQNHMNRRKFGNTSSRYKGVYWSSKDKKWIAQITTHHHRTVIGYFDTERHAAMAYDISAKSLFSSYAWLNFPTAIHFAQ